MLLRLRILYPSRKVHLLLFDLRGLALYLPALCLVGGVFGARVRMRGRRRKLC
jgi:hypothetical protein